MSEQEKKSGASTAGGSSPLVMVEQSTGSRHKPYRPTDLQDETTPDLHHKRSRAPAVPSVAEELKDSAETTEAKEQKESENAMSSEKPKHIVATKLSSTTKRRGSSPETISMAPLEVEAKIIENMITPLKQPIPSKVDPITAAESDNKIKISEVEKIDDEESITEEIAELRTPDPTQKTSEWGNESQNYKRGNEETEDRVPLKKILASETVNSAENEKANRKVEFVIEEAEDPVPLQRKLGSETVNGITSVTSTHQLKKSPRTRKAYLDIVQLQDLNPRISPWMLERKASVGPCYRKTMPYGEPSGITICLPKKSLKNINEINKPIKSGISITISKRCLRENNLQLPMDFELRNISDRLDLPRKARKIEIKIEEDNCANFFGNLKGKLDNLRGKIKNVLHM